MYSEKVRQDALAELTIIYEVMANPQFGKAVAKFIKNVFDALKEEGFNDDQVLQIITQMKFK